MLFCSQVCSGEINLRNLSCSEGFPCSSEVRIIQGPRVQKVVRF